MQFDVSKLEKFYAELNGAIFSNTRHKRFVLWRTWDLNNPHILFIGINPSTADEKKNDPTITKLMAISKSWGYGGLIIMNLHAYVSTDPKHIRRSTDYEVEDLYLEQFGNIAQEVIVIWGNEGEKSPDRVKRMRKLFPNAECFKQNKNGQPLHPLYLSKEDWFTEQFDWNKI